MEPTNKENSVGAIIASILVIALLIIAGLYFWGQKAVDNKAPTAEQTQADIQAAVASDPAVAALKQASTSDDKASIKADLDATNLDNI